MRAISLEIANDRLKLWVFHDGPVSQDEADHFDSVVVTQMVADFPDVEKGDPICGFEFIRLDQPEKIEPRGEFVFFRWEAEMNEGI